MASSKTFLWTNPHPFKITNILRLHHITVQNIISTGFVGCHTHRILVIVLLTLSASAMARAPSSPIPFSHKLKYITCNITYDCNCIIITVQSILYTGFIGCHTHRILVIVALNSSASAMARAPSPPIPLPHKLQNFKYNIHHYHGPEYHIHRIR
jgi:hypothetical protein